MWGGGGGVGLYYKQTSDKMRKELKNVECYNKVLIVWLIC